MVIKREIHKEKTDTYTEKVCEFKEEGYCMASKTQNPVIPCEYADYNAHSYYPTCSKKAGGE